MVIPLFKGALLRISLALLVLFFSVSAYSENTQNTDLRLSLNKAISLTLAQNPQLHQFSIKKQVLLGRRSSSDLSPGLNLDVDVENFGGTGDYSSVNASEVTLALSSVIEIGSKRSARVSVANARLNVIEFQKQAFTLDILGELTTVFVRTLENQELTSLAKEARDIAQYTLKVVKNRARQGAAPELEIKRATASLAQSQLQLDALQHQHERNRIKLARYWGETSNPWLQLEGDLYAFGNQPDFSDLYQRILSSPAIEVFSSEVRLKAAELQLSQTQSKLDVSWQVGVRRFEETGDSAFTAGVSIPLFSGKRNRGSIATALAERDEVAFKQKNALLHLHSQLFDAYSQRSQQIHAAHIFQTTVIPELTSALQSTQHAYETGRYSYQDWIAAQQELIRAKQILIENAASAVLNQVIIEQLVAEPLK